MGIAAQCGAGTEGHRSTAARHACGFRHLLQTTVASLGSFTRNDVTRLPLLRSPPLCGTQRLLIDLHHKDVVALGRVLGLVLDAGGAPHLVHLVRVRPRPLHLRS